MRHSTDSYFVKLGGEPYAGVPGPGTSAIPGRDGLGQGSSRPARRRRRRPRGRLVLVVLVLAGLGSWTYWASQRPGGVSGTINGWISHTRGDVASVSTDPDFDTARRFFSGQYVASKQYPQLSESDLTAAGIGVGVNVENCGPQAVVIQGASGGGTLSRLLLAGKDLGALSGKYDCPADLTHPLPWKVRS